MQAFLQPFFDFLKLRLSVIFSKQMGIFFYWYVILLLFDITFSVFFLLSQFKKKKKKKKKNYISNPFKQNS